MKNVKQLVKEFYEVIFSQGLTERVGDYITTDATMRVGETVHPMGVDGMKAHIQAVRATYPDFAMQVTRQYCDGDYVISEVIATGTHLGEFMGIVPTGKVLEFTGVDIDKVVGGKICEHSGAINTFETLMAAGAIVGVSV